MNIKRTLKNNPKTTFLGVLTTAIALWKYLGENAEIFGISSKIVLIIGASLTGVLVAYNAFTGGKIPPNDDEGFKK